MSDGQTNILLDCGIPVQKIKEFLWNEGKRLSDIDACLVTHSHGDHVKSAQRLADMGISVYTGKGTIESAELIGVHVKNVWKSDVEIGSPAAMRVQNMCIVALPVKHDAPDTLAFSIQPIETNERLLYVTDTPYFQYLADGVTHLMIEANNDPQIILQNAVYGKISPEHLKRVVQNHMSIETCLKTIQRLDKSRLKEVWLLHLSNDNAGDDFKRRVQEVAGCEVYVA